MGESGSGNGARAARPASPAEVSLAPGEREGREAVPADRADASDEALMLCAQGGELTSLQELMLRYEKGLYNFLVRYTGDRHLAEDLFQDCFLRVVKKRESFDPTRGFRPWLFAIAANLARDACRRRKLRSREPTADRLAPRGDVPRPDEEAEKSEELRMVRRIVEELPDDARAMVLLHFYQELTYREVAEALDAPVGTVKSRVHWAVERLARAWNERAESAFVEGSSKKGA